jgi:hypothetical protein
MTTNGKECKNLNRSLVAATFEKANTYVFAGMVIMNPNPAFWLTQTAPK